MHYYPHHIGDYRSGTMHLSNEEDLAYRRLLEMYYDTEQPIPLETQWVARRLRVDTEALNSVLKDFFQSTPDGWRNAKCDLVIREYHEMADKNRRNGMKGGRPRINKQGAENPVGSQSDASGMPVATHSKANQEPVTINQEPITKNQNSVSKDTGVKTPMSPDEIIFGYGVPLLTNAGTVEAKARSFLGGLRKAHGDEALVNTLRDCIRAKPLQPLEWLAAALPPAGIKPKPNKQEALEASNRAVVERKLKKEGWYESEQKS